MNWDQVEGQWKRLRGRAKQHWGELTDSDLDRIEGKREQLVGKLQERYGKNKEAIEREIDAWISSL